jgi:hypothetical protein
MNWAKVVLFLRNLKNIVLGTATVLLAIFAIFFASWKVLPWLLPGDWRTKYAIEYLVNEDQVNVERKPHDCEWDSAPLGNKHCHYEALVAVYNSDGKVIDGTDAEVDPSGTEISYDHKKTWQVRPADQKATKVTVVWQRADD